MNLMTQTETKVEQNFNLFHDVKNRATQYRLISDYCPYIELVHSSSELTIICRNDKGKPYIMKILPLLYHHRYDAFIYYTSIHIKFEQRTLTFHTGSGMHALAKDITILEYILTSGNVSNISTATGYGIIASPTMLNEAEGEIQVPRIYNKDRIHDRNFYANNYLEIRNDFLRKDKKIIGFEYDSYLSRDVLNPNRNQDEPLSIYRVCQDCELITFCNELVVLSTFKFA